MTRIILASASPRRKELLLQLGLTFEVLPACGEEHITKEKPEEIVRELAFQKASEVSKRCLAKFPMAEQKQEQEIIKVIGADTIVVCGGAVLGKPADGEDARRMLGLLQGRTHQVYTGVCVMTLSKNGEDTDVIEFSEKTEVSMYPAHDGEIRAYIATGEPMDKSGAYAIQGISARFIKEIRGDYYNVVGLPIARLWQECFKDWTQTGSGISPRQDPRPAEQ